MKKITLQINNRKVEAKEGATLLEAAREAGIDIPTLCHDDRLKPSGACRMCMVEIEKGNRKRLVASCLYVVEPNLVVTTDTPQLRKMRRLIIELLWPAWEDRADEFGISQSRFAPACGDCSLCGKCVRYCAEVAKKNVVYFKGRGIHREVAFTPGTTGECDGCMKCFVLCSGGFLMAERSKDHDEP